MTNKKIYTLLTVFLVIFWTGFIMLGIRFAPTERRYDCSMAEFHPDYPPEVREKCRVLRATKL